MKKPPAGFSRRQVLQGAGLLGLGLVVGCGDDGNGSGNTFRFRQPGSLPDPTLPEGTDTLPEIEHIIILMMENHSFDNYFGMLDPDVGFPLKRGIPTAANPDGNGSLIHAFHMPSTCQLEGHPGQNWNASHLSYGDGRNDGFVLASGPVAMGYWAEPDLPFYYGLARTFPLASRWFGSTLCQTYPNRRFLMAGTAAGIISTSTAALNAPPPPNGNIFQRLDAYGISWRNYFSDLPSVFIFPRFAQSEMSKLTPVAQFFADAAAGTLPAVSLVDPIYNSSGSEENPDDIRDGEEFAARVINAAMSGPGWPKTLLVWLYDEHGGYYDHVPPPAAVLPDDTPPMLGPNDLPGAYNRYGFRVPLLVISPWAKRGYVSSVVQDHTSILRFVERKWNLGAMTRRDANARDMTDYFDFRRAAFREPPKIASAPALAPGLERCRAAGLNPPLPGQTSGERDLAGLRARARAAGLRV